MTPNEYQQAALRTDGDDEFYLDAHDRTDDYDMMRLLHASIGIATEAGELQDALKKHPLEGK